MFDKFLGVVAFYKRQGQFVYGYVFVLFQLYVLAGVAVDLVKILDGNIIVRAFVFQNVDFAEDRGDVFFDGDVRNLFYDYNVNSQWLGGELVL